jgi:phosphoglycerol transferase MdoB-like AlkP superfamily enzyme
MLELSLRFMAASLILLTTSRLLLSAWQWQRVKSAGGLWPILKGGLRIDANQIAVLAGIPLLASPWLGVSPLAMRITEIWFLLGWFLLVLLEVSTPQFIQEYDTRPNKLYVQYLKHPREVFGMLWKGYRGTIVLGVIGMGLLVWLGFRWFQVTDSQWVINGWLKPVATLVFAALIFLAIRGTLSHRPINPSTVAYCGDGLLNSLPLNSLYSVVYAIYSMKNERSAADVYGDLDGDTLLGVVQRSAGLPDSTTHAIPTLHHQSVASGRERPLNLVLIVEESLGAQFTGYLGGAGLTPCLDALNTQSWSFHSAYATGTRSVRGLEALVAGFPPTVSDAVLRLPGAQSRFCTLAHILKQAGGYRSRFIYGGEAHFDNMKSFFLGNGFDELHDLPTFDNPAFKGTWGASDEDMFTKLHTLLMQDTHDQPTLTLAFSVSNHSPWEYPPGRIAVDGDPATVENTVRYADWALGQFFEQAKTSPYWENTVFMVAADHDARVGGANLIPLKNFHIPAMILGGTIEPRIDQRLISQIDLPPTLLSLLGIATEHPMIGHDLGLGGGGRAMMQYGENYGYLKGDTLLVLEPHRPASQYRYAAPDTYQPQTLNQELATEALAHALWPTWVYQNQAYTLPHLVRSAA